MAGWKYYGYRFSVEYRPRNANHAVFCFHGFKYRFLGNNYGQTSRSLVRYVLHAVRKKFRVVSLSELLGSINRLPDGHQDPPMAAFTIDDGFSSILDVLDLFKKFSAVPTIFVCPELMENDTLPFQEVVRLAFLLTGRNDFSKPRSEKTESIKNIPEKIRMTREWIEYFKRLPKDEMRGALAELLAALKVSEDTIRKSKFFDPLLRFEQLKEMHPFINVGSHTCTHSQLSSLSDQDALKELSASKWKIENGLSVACELLAYPFGNHGAFGTRELEYAKTCGYRAAFNLEPGYAQHNKGRYDLPRINVGGGFKYLLQRQRAGVL